MNENDRKLFEASTYLGDGAYLHADDYHVTLLTTDGMSITNKVHLDPETLNNFLRELQRRGRLNLS
jgi:hypothetical protein